MRWVENYYELIMCIGVGCALIQLFISMLSIVRNNKREKKEATLSAYLEVYNTIFSITHRLYRRFGYEKIPYCTIMDASEVELFNDVKTLLNSYEHISTATLLGIYDIKTLRRLYGVPMTCNWERLKEYVIRAREDVKDPTLYKDFETLIIKMNRDRRKLWKFTHKTRRK